MSSRMSGFYKLPIEKRIEVISEHVPLTVEEKDLLMKKSGLKLEQADRMVENAVGFIPIPIGIGVNFKVNGKDVFIPMATEEPSVIAAASHAAKLTYEKGGFFTSYTGSIMRGQVQISQVENPYLTMAKIYEHKVEIINRCNEQDPTLVSLGGGAKDLEVQVIEVDQEKMVIVHILVDTKDAMGANAVNTMAEAVTPLIEKLSNGQVVLRILSNLADQRIVRARATFKNPFNNDVKQTKKFINAYKLAKVDPYRAATHNKGIMNGISAVVLATGNDTRAVEAGAHAYASRNGIYQSLTHWEVMDDQTITGVIELPLAVGLVGGATQAHPIAKLMTKILQVTSSEELAGIIASVGLAQNFAALRALSDEGIQQGHMKLHARNMARMAGATEEQIDQVLTIANEKGLFRFDDLKAIIKSLK